MQNPVQPKAKAGPPLASVGEHATQLSVVGGESRIVAFAVLRDGKEYVPTKITIVNNQVVSRDPCGPKGIYEPTAYEYLMAAVMDHYRLKGLKA